MGSSLHPRASLASSEDRVARGFVDPSAGNCLPLLETERLELHQFFSFHFFFFLGGLCSPLFIVSWLGLYSAVVLALLPPIPSFILYEPEPCLYDVPSGSSSSSSHFFVVVSCQFLCTQWQPPTLQQLKVYASDSLFRRCGV